MLFWLASVIAWMPPVLLPVERLSGAELRLDLLRSGGVPAGFHLDPSSVLALCAALLVWIAGNLWSRPREA